MSRNAERAIGAGIVAVMAVHAATNPHRAWVLFACCDVAAMATAIGLVAGWYRVVGVSLLFQLSVGLPSLIVGLLTTYVPTATGVAIHLLPTAAGLVVVAAHGLPRRAALVAGAAYVFILVATYALAPPALNINLVHAVWAPVASLFSTRAAYYASHVGVVVLALSLGEVGARRLLARR